MGNARIWDMIYWFSGMPDWIRFIPPAEIPFGKFVYTCIGWQNTGTQPQQGHVELVVTKPDGTPLALSATQNQDAWGDPGVGQFVQFQPLMLNQGGAWSALVTLSTEAAPPPPTLSSLIFKLNNPPAGPTHWLPYWKPLGKDWIVDPRGWIPITDMGWFQNVPGGRGVFGWYFWDAVAGMSIFYATPEIVAAEGDIWTYWYNTGQLTRSAPAMMSRRFVLMVRRGDPLGFHLRRR